MTEYDRFQLTTKKIELYRITYFIYVYQSICIGVIPGSPDRHCRRSHFINVKMNTERLIL